ncbi:hypothetical protein PSTT_13720, partial [Puccinia striiformis]
DSPNCRNHHVKGETVGRPKIPPATSIAPPTILLTSDNIERTIDDIHSHINILCPESTTYTTPNDQDLEQFKSFRLRILRAQFWEAFPFINILFCDAYRLLESLIIDSEASVKFPTFPKRLSQQADILLYRLDDQMYKRIRIRHCSVFLETLLHKPQQYTHRC